jgi:DNA replication protein DnaC
MKHLGEMLVPSGKKTSKSIEANSAGASRVDSCEICGGLGWISADVPVGHPMFGKLVPCPHRKAELNQSVAAQAWSDLGPLRQLTFDNFRPEGHAITAEQQTSLKNAFDWTREFAKEPRGWLLIQGGYGCGKTHLAAAIANACLSEGIPVTFVNVPDLLDYLRAAYNPAAEETYDERFNDVRDAAVLILDDLGTQNSTAWAEEKLFQLLNARYISKRPTVITTNLEIDDLDPRLGSRLSDLDLVRKLPILASDFRRSTVEQGQHSLSSLALYHDKTFKTFSFRTSELSGEMRDNLRQAVEVAKNFAEDPQDWLVFTGNYGCGKTHLAAAISNERAYRGYPVMFVVVPDLLDYLRAAFSPDSNSPLYKRFDEVRMCSLLIMDDLGTESATPWAREKLYQIVNYRYMARLPTVITTSLTMAEIDPRIRVRILDENRCLVFPIIVPNYRGGADIQQPRQERTPPKKYKRRAS